MIPTTESPIICSTDGGLASIREHNIPFVSCTSYKDVAEFRNWMAGSKEARQFKTFWFDDFSEICELYLLQAFAAGSAGGKEAHGQKVYGQMADEMMAFLRSVKEVTTHVIGLICKQDRIQDINKNLIYFPMVPGKALPPYVTYYIGQVYRMESYTDPATRQSMPTIRCIKNDSCEAKDRSGKLLEIEYAHMGNIIAKTLS